MKTIYRWGPVIVWMGVIFFFSTRQRIVVSPAETINFLFFKTLHVIEYAILYLLTFRATKNVVTSFLIVILYASSDEIHQLFVATREGTVRDVIIDGLGACLAWILVAKLLPVLPRKLQKWARRLLAT
jgi:VanZ family protein